MTTKAGYFDWGVCMSTPATMQAATTHFSESGYVIFTSFCTGAETSSLRAQANKLIGDFHNARPTSSPASVFTTEEQTRKMDAGYFLRSASRISCFLEEKQAGDDASPAINKIGHALHDLDAVFGPFSRQEKVRAVAAALGVAPAVLVQSMYILKGARVGGKVTAHRDATFVRASEGVCLGYWWALQDADEENACLWAVPGSHRDGREMKRFVRGEQGMVFEGQEDADAYPEDRYMALPMREGDLVMLDGRVVHKSKENRSDKSRHAYSIHVVAGGLEERGWLRREEGFPFREL